MPHFHLFMSKRSVDSETEHSTSKKVKPQRLDFKSANETNNVTIAKINGMSSLIEEHFKVLRSAELIVSIEVYRRADTSTIELSTRGLTPPIPCDYAIDLNGSKGDLQSTKCLIYYK